MTIIPITVPKGTELRNYVRIKNLVHLRNCEQGGRSLDAGAVLSLFFLLLLLLFVLFLSIFFLFMSLFVLFLLLLEFRFDRMLLPRGILLLSALPCFNFLVCGGE